VQAASSSAGQPARAGRVGRDLAGAATILMAAFLLSRLTGLLRTIAISYRFGTGPDLDAYVAAMRIPDFLFQVVAGGAVASAFIPVLAGYLAQDDSAGAWRLVSGLVTLAVAIMVPISAVIWLLAPQVMALVAPEFSAEQQAKAAELARIVLLSPTLFAIGTLITSVLNAHQRFLLAALAPTCYNLGIILGAALLAGPLGIHGLATGAALGAAAYLAIQLPGLFRCGWRYAPTLGLADPGVRKVGALMIPRTLGLAVAQVNFVVIVAFASAIPGAITALDYAWTLTMLPLGIFAMAISTAVFPTLADQTARDQVDEMVATLAGTLRVILYLTIPASIGLIVLGEPIVRLLLERGAFTAESTELTARALRFYALGLLGHATVEIVTRAFYALHDTRTPVAVAALAMAVNVALALLLRPAFGHGGLALALSAAAMVEATVLLLLARRRLGDLHGRAVSLTALRALAGAGALAVVVAPVARWLEPLGQSGLLGRALEVGLAMLVGGLVYAAVTAILGAEEPGRFVRLARRRLG
jgi:putative peptidoglycan lipid II flippase